MSLSDAHSQPRLATVTGLAILTVSAAGLVHGALSLPWTPSVQGLYAAMGAFASWRLVR